MEEERKGRSGVKVEGRRFSGHHFFSSVLRNLLTSEVDYLSGYDNTDKKSWKSALRSSTLCMLATTWEQYGNR